MKYLLPLIIFTCLLSSCNQPKNSLFEQLPPEKTGITFSNTLSESDTFNILNYTYYYNGGGVGIGDVNNDGLSDIYFTGNEVSGKLYLNKGNWQFEDITEQAGVSTDRWARGVSIVDINADGLLDIYLSVAGTTHTTQTANLLFINQGKNSKGLPVFKEMAEAYGLADKGHTVQTAFFDYDRDGDLDAYLLTNAIEAESFSPNFSRVRKTSGEGLSTDRLYRNEGNGTDNHPVFKNVSREAGITIEGYGLGLAVSDLNADGWPDVYCANDFLPNDLVWINNRNGTFTNCAATLLKHQSYNAMGTDIADFNNDGLPDIVVLDMAPPDSKRDKTVGSGAVTYDKYYYDLKLGYEPQLVRNTLQLNNGTRPMSAADSIGLPSFSEIGELAGISRTDWSWSALFADFDNDGYRDLFVTNGYGKDVINMDHAVYHDQLSQEGDPATVRRKQYELAQQLPATKLHNYLFRNNGNLTFTDKSLEWGLDLPTLSNGAAFADLDNDGDLDLVINNINDPAGLYQNHAADRDSKQPNGESENINHFLRIKLAGPQANQQGLGTKIRIRYGANIQVHDHGIYRGFQSTVESIVHFGLGGVRQIDTLEVFWPDGKYQLFQKVQTDQLLTADYRNATVKPSTTQSSSPPLLVEASASFGISYEHRENNFVDFKSQILLPQKYSQNGPGIAVGDINKDGLEDFYIGGASGSAGKLFVQELSSSRTPLFKSRLLDQEGKQEEDMAALFFDADNDQDQDLYVVSGGNEFPANSPLYQDRLYVNDGKGNFTKDSLALPVMLASGSCVTAADFDRDGDLDLFIGTRLSPNAYPYVSRSYLLRNDQNLGKGLHFTDITTDADAGLRTPGLVTAALWTDFDNDGWMDLVLTGEWMPITFFKNNQGQLLAWDADQGLLLSAKGSSTNTNQPADHSKSQSLKHSAGWWNSLVSGDFDNDGDVDYAAGNLGLNSKFKASPEEPVSLYARDFDKNGTLDPILCYFLPGPDGKRASYPAPSRDNFMAQIPSKRNQFSRYEDYAMAKAEDLFSEEDREKAYQVRSENFQSSYIENLGGGKFQLKPLPIQAQFAPVFGMVCSDYDGDGNLDLLLSGNSYATEVQTGQYDALIGLYLKGDGKGNFSPLPCPQSGLFIDGDAKGMAELLLGTGKPLLLVASNAGKLKGFSTNPGFTRFSTPQNIPLSALEVSAVATLADGRKRKMEVYYGSGYLSQSSRVLCLPKDATAITITDYSGKQRVLHLPLSLLSSSFANQRR